MATLIAVAAIVSLIAGGIVAGIGMVSFAIHREEKNLTLTSEVPGQLTGAVRWLNGVYVRVPGQPAGTGHVAPRELVHRGARSRSPQSARL